MSRLREFYDGLSGPQKNRLKRYICGGCDARLDHTLRSGCLAYLMPPCGQKTVLERATNCLNAARKKEIRLDQ